MFHWGRGSPARASGGRSLTGGALRRRAKSTNGIIEEDTGKTGIPAQHLQESVNEKCRPHPVKTLVKDCKKLRMFAHTSDNRFIHIPLTMLQVDVR